MRRKILTGLLVIGAVVGLGSGFAHLRHGHRDGRQRAAEICVDAAIAVARGRDPIEAARTADHWERGVAATCADAARDHRPAGDRS